MLYDFTLFTLIAVDNKERCTYCAFMHNHAYDYNYYTYGSNKETLY